MLIPEEEQETACISPTSPKVCTSDVGEGKEGAGVRVVGHIDIHAPSAEAPEVEEDLPEPQED